MTRLLNFKWLASLGGLLLLGLISFYPSYTKKPFYWHSLCTKVQRKVTDFWVATKSGHVFSSLPCPVYYLDQAKLSALLAHPRPWMRELIARDFAEFPSYSRAQLHRAYQESIPLDNFNLFRIQNGRVTVEDKLPDMNGACRYAQTMYLQILQYLVDAGYLVEKDLLLSLTETTVHPYSPEALRAVGPLLAVAKDITSALDDNRVLIPDWMNLETWPKTAPKIARANAKTKWAEKKPVIFWRGGEADISGYRHQVVALSHALNHKQIDAQFSYGPNSTTGFVLPEDHVEYKYQLNIDGHTAAWERPVWQLYSNCVMLKQASPLIQWYYPAMQPGVHYVDVGTEPEALLNRLGQYSDAQLQQIAQNGHAFAARELNAEAMFAYLILALQEYQQRQVD